MRKIIGRLFVLACGLGLMIACRHSPEFVVTGVVAGADEQTLYLENVGLTSIEVMDSAKLNASGRFTFKKARPDFPDFYRLRLNNQLINFAVDSTETITFTADAGTFATSYSVEGSENCIAIKEITLAQLDANQEIRRVRREAEAHIISDSLLQQLIIDAVNNYKTVALKYIYTQPGSTASYFALFQKIDGLLFFDLYDRVDSRAYGAVATNYSYRYPESPRAMHLTNLALQSLKVTRSERGFDIGETTAQEVDFLEIDLPDIRNEKIKLTEIAQGKVVILNFTAYQTEFSPGLNQLLEDIYLSYHSRGLKIYQVSLDSDLHFWKNVVSNLPWICVYDPQGAFSQSAAVYNVQQLPALFILDRKGVLVKRVDNLNTLNTDIQSLL
jgi:alkyl hydroperoxide reductase subunit AhpC